MQLLEKDRGKFYTPDELEQAIGMQAANMGTIVFHMGKRGIVIRRKRDDSRAYEYAAGPRLDWGLKHVGHKFTRRGRNRREYRATKFKAAAAPSRGLTAPGAYGAGLIIRFGGAAHAVKMDEARAIYDDLRTLFGE